MRCKRERGFGLPVSILASALLSTCLEKWVLQQELSAAELVGLCSCVGAVLAAIALARRAKGRTS